MFMLHPLWCANELGEQEKGAMIFSLISIEWSTTTGLQPSRLFYYLHYIPLPAGRFRSPPQGTVLRHDWAGLWVPTQHVALVLFAASTTWMQMQHERKRQSSVPMMMPVRSLSLEQLNTLAEQPWCFLMLAGVEQQAMPMQHLCGNARSYAWYGCKEEYH